MADECELENHSREISRNIPDELLFEDILVRLPVKSLIAYKSVCKTWLHTIESRSFIEAHRRCHSCECSDQILFTSFKSISDPVTKSSSLLPRLPSIATDLIEMEHIPLEDLWLPLEMTRLNWPDVQLDDPDAANPSIRLEYWTAISILGPIRTTNIYCLVAYLRRSKWMFMYHFFPTAKIVICNPATREYKLANPFPPKEMPRLLELASRNYSRAHYGFGVASDGDYKVVVVIVCHPTYGSFFSYVYSLRQGAWKKIVDSENGMISRLDLRGKRGFPCINDDYLELCPQVFLNGCWHWITNVEDGMLHVLTFNVDRETFNLVWGPPSYRERMLLADGMRISSVLTMLNGHLALLDHLRGVGGSDMDEISVWMMMEYGDEESWINVWRVNLESYHIRTLVGITYSLREDSNDNGGIQINKVLFEDLSLGLVSCDEFGTGQTQDDFDTSSCIFWNSLGISAYRETLERLSPSKHGTAAA